MRDLSHVRTGATGRPARQRWIATLLLIPALAGAAAPSGVSTSVLGDGSFLVSLSLNAQLEALNPAVVRGAWSCSAKSGSKRTIDTELAKINALTGRAAFDAYQSLLVYPAHYYGQQAAVDFVVAKGSYRGSEKISIKLVGRELADRATGRVIDDPGVMVGCWLRLYDAAGKGGFAYQSGVAGPAGSGAADALLAVPSAPYVLLSADVPNE